MPAAGWRREVQNRPDTRSLQHGNIVGPSVGQSLTHMNQSIRGVLPLKGVEGSIVQPTKLRKQPVPYEGGLYPKQGYARNQPKGLSYLNEKPLNRPPMPRPDFFDPEMNAKLARKM